MPFNVCHDIDKFLYIEQIDENFSYVMCEMIVNQLIKIQIPKGAISII